MWRECSLDINFLLLCFDDEDEWMVNDEYEDESEGPVLCFFFKFWGVYIYIYMYVEREKDGEVK